VVFVARQGTGSVSSSLRRDRFESWKKSRTGVDTIRKPGRLIAADPRGRFGADGHRRELGISDPCSPLLRGNPPTTPAASISCRKPRETPISRSTLGGRCPSRRAYRSAPTLASRPGTGATSSTGGRATAWCSPGVGTTSQAGLSAGNTKTTTRIPGGTFDAEVNADFRVVLGPTETRGRGALRIAFANVRTPAGLEDRGGSAGHKTVQGLTRNPALRRKA